MSDDYDAEGHQAILAQADRVRSLIEGTMYAPAAGEAARLIEMLVRADAGLP